MPDPIREIVEGMRRLLPSERPACEYDIPEQFLKAGDQPYLPLDALVERNRHWYVLVLRMLLGFRDDYRRIPVNPVGTAGESATPSWRNCDLPVLDALSLYGFLCLNRPGRYLEIGAGESTRFARRAVDDHRLATDIISISSFMFPSGWFAERARTDPDDLIGPTVFSDLEEGDVVRVATYHTSGIRGYSEMVQYVLPNIRPGVYVQLQDLFVPSDISPDRSGGSYADQLLVAEMIHSGEMDIILPCNRVARDAELNTVLSPVTEDLRLDEGEMQGRSLWVRTR
ncbi:hypothetical protein FGU65_02615 [Methanoculleus sp. FWC-SCC1]|uniref:Class I SAM-dependent methyltransferase n=1 Tax=Methanoculleus frigidifontis TaxID=2584085 RepID=A0ABT8M791_9EURY|nr:hypothetical protein [Methanoculleus sp. FWC-SCC1]MDN7023799.1 hypothetical protein [Methanoculleus sp. FWC-SCC1]